MLGALLRQMRLESHLTQKQVADIVGVRQQSYWKYEQGLAEPDLEVIVRLAELYSMRVDDLLEFNIDDYEGY